jgi:hypothetical protein
MRTGCRSVERLFYWWKIKRVPTTAGRHNPKAPLFFFKGKACLAVMLLAALTMSTIVLGQGPALTTISDTVYRADGSLAAGTVLISWPAFLSAGGDTVAAGNLNVTLGPLGVFVAQLVPNIGASPAGTYYIVVFQLDDGTVRKEYWAVSSTSPTTIAAVQTTPGTGLANLAVSQQYVDAQVANRALDSAVVHLTGSETIAGSKQFVSPPTLPQPVGANDAVTKGYVDTAVGNVGGGAFVSRAGDTMTGPLSLPGDPSAPNQAADRHYVDNGLLAKADLVGGHVPTSELGTGLANAVTCLTGNSTWGSCGSGVPAGNTYATTALNWTQGITRSLTGGSSATITLTPCPLGIDTTSGAGYQVLISGGGTSEVVSVVTSFGGCLPGAASGTITFTPFYSYATGATIGSASGGLQETLNASCGISPTAYLNNQCNVTIPANGPNSSINTYNVYGTLYLHANQSVLNGYGVSLNCLGRGPCLQIGDLINSNDYSDNTVTGISFRTPVNLSSNSAFAGVPIIQTQRASQLVTITTASAHGFRVGDMVTILFTDSSFYWGDAVVTAVPSATTFKYAFPGVDLAPQSTPGVVALAYVAVLDNAMDTHLIDISYDKAGENGQFNNFFDLWDDENATIQHFNNQAISLNGNANWTGSFVFSAGNQAQQIAPVITLRDSTITANGSNGITVYNSNGLYVENTVLQAAGPWQVYSSNTTGNFQGAYLKNIYSESNATLNPLTPALSPYAGLGIAGLIAGPSTGAASFQIAGNGGTSGAFAAGATTLTLSSVDAAGNYQGTITGGAGNALVGKNFTIAGFNTGGNNLTNATVTASTSTRISFGVTTTIETHPATATVTSTGSLYTYYIVANDVTANTNTSPMQVLNWQSTGSSDQIPVRWPRVANGTNVISYDVIRMLTPVGVGALFPWSGANSCPGGSGGTCGYVALGLSQLAACSGGLICTYTDTGSAATSPYAIRQGNYPGNLTFWPGSIVSVNKSVAVDKEEGTVVGVGLAGAPIQVSSQCSGFGPASPGGYTACAASATLVGNSIPNQTATLMTDGPSSGGSNQTLSKGRLNFATTPYTAVLPHHIITLIDSQPGLTEATNGYRPPANANDVWIGTDVPSGGVNLDFGQLAFGAPVSITNYIRGTGDGVQSNWLERLTAAQREFNIPVKFDQSVTIAGLTNGCLNVASGVISSTGASCGTGGGGVISAFGRTGAVVATTGDYSVAQVTGAAADAAVVHNSGTETISGIKTFSTNVIASTNLVLPQGSAYIPAVGGIGLDTSAALPVVNIGGTTHQIAFTSSNISGQAGTALALAASPTQCSGAFATGIASNGNANCTTPNVIQLSETTQPAGIPNWGIFWFDSASHTPRIIENNGQVMQLGLTNLFNSDPGGDPADNLEQRNGSVAQNFRAYSSFTSNTSWQRTSVGFDATDNYAVVRSENATSASAPGLGFWIGSGLKWVVDAAGTFKPWTDNIFNVGSDSGNAAKSVFAKTSFNSVVYGRNDFEIPNDATTGTVLNELAIFTSSNPSQAIVSSTTSTNGVIGIVQGTAGKTGNAVITWRGYAYCIFDNATTAGDTVVASTSLPGECHDAGSTSQPTAQLIGYVDVTNAASGQTNGVRINLQPPQAGGGSVASVFGRTGAVVAASGDYSASQITGAAIDSAVVHLAGTETVSGVKTFASNLTLNGNLSVAGSITQTGSGPTQWSGQQWTGTTVTVPSGLAFSLGVGSDNIFKCQMASGTSCLPASSVTSVFGRTGAVVAASGDYSVAQITGAAPLASPTFTGTPTVPGYATTSTTVNGHALSSNVTVAASDITTGTLPAAQLPAPSCSWITMPTQGGSGNAFSGTNKAIVWGVYNPYPCVTNNVAYVVGTADNTANNYAIGLYSGTSGGTGTLIATTASSAGTALVPSIGIKHVAWNATNISVPAGRVYIALTSNCASACAALLGSSGSGVTWAANLQVSVTTGGAALPATLTLPADSFSSGASIPALIVY